MLALGAVLQGSAREACRPPHHAPVLPAPSPTHAASGRCATLDTGHGRVHRILAAPAPAEAWYPRLPGSQAVAARLAVLFASGLVGVFDLDQQGESGGRAGVWVGGWAASRLGWHWLLCLP